MKTVFFDFDGVLMDTEPRYSRFWMAAAKTHGLPMDYARSLELRSLDSGLAREHFLAWYDADVYDAVRATRRMLMEEDRRTHPVAAKAGAAALLTELERVDIPYYIVTASTQTRVERYTKDAGLPDVTARVISTKAVARGKPYPDVYLAALDAAGCAASEAIAVEDSPNGIRSAKAAGCVTVMVPDLTPPTEEDRAYCDTICADLSAFGVYLQKPV